MFSCTAAENNEELDTRKMVDVLKTHHLVPPTTCSNVKRGLINLITKGCVPTEISHDLLNARTIGQADYEATVKYHSLKDSSVAVPKRKRKLQTIKSPTKKGKRRSKADEEKMLITFCTKKQLHGQSNMSRVLSVLENSL